MPGPYLQPARPGKTPERGEKTYRKLYSVIGPREVGGVKRGGTVELELTAAQEKVLIEAGHIELAVEAKTGSPVKEN